MREFVDVAQLDHAVLFSSVASRGRGISACFKNGITHCKTLICLCVVNFKRADKTENINVYIHLHIVGVAVSGWSTDGERSKIQLNSATGADSDRPRTVGVVRIVVRMAGTLDHSTWVTHKGTAHCITQYIAEMYIMIIMIIMIIIIM